MTDKLPPNLLALFAPRPPLRWVPPSDHAPEERRTAKISGLAAFLPQLQEYKETDVYHPTESWLEKKDRLKREKKENQEKLLSEGPAGYKPQDDPNIRGDAFKTLIVARLSYDATEQDLESEFGRFGPIERIRIVVDSQPKPTKKPKKHRGYAFVVYEREKDMRAALENCDGIRIKDRRIKVDVERGRTVKGWKPRRFGGGLGGRGHTRTAPPRPMGFGAPGGFGNGPSGPGGFRGGGFRGGFDGGRGGRGNFGGRGGGGFQDRGGFGGGRGGIGYQGGRGGFNGGDRGFANGAPPPNAPAGPGGRGGFGGGGYSGRPGAGSPDRNGPSSGGGYGSRDGGRPSYDDRNGGYRGGGGGGRDYQRDSSRTGSGSNMEPVRPREGGGYRDRDRDDSRRDDSYSGRPRDDDSRKRGYEGSGYEDPRKLRRY